MKRGNYGILERRGYWAPDWNRLKLELENNIFFQRLAQSIGVTLLGEPPKRMDGKDTFEEASSSEDIIDSVKIVRNNLFHGGKFHGGPNEMESVRNITLIEESLVILKLIIEDAALQFQDCDSLRAHFNEYI